MREQILFYLTFLCFAVSTNTNAQTTDPYTWKNVPIGGGGYITGMQIHPLNGEKRYYRTDVGGAYRWNTSTQRMEQMIFLENKNLYSVAGIALHPTNENIVYLSVGRNCDPNQNEILISTDAGANFSIVDIVGGVPFWFAANGGRDCGNNSDKDRQGTPLAINPHNTNELYIGTRSKGLYILDLTTYELTQVPNTSIPENNQYQSIRSVVFHPTNNLVYIAYTGHGVYVGNTTTQVYTQYGTANNTQLQDAIDISLSKDANYILVACKTQGIMKATNITGTLSWTLLSGYNSADDEGYLTVDCSPHDDNVAITVVADWNHIDQFQVTTDAGDTWTEIEGSVAPEDNNFKWRNEAFASHVSQIAFDPSNASKIHYTSWFSTYTCDNFVLAGPNSWHNDYSKGHEEIVTTDLVAFPTNSDGQFLMAGSGDHSGFLFDSNISNQDSFATFTIADRGTSPFNPLKKNASLDFCEKQSDHLVACLTEEWHASDAGIVTSDDGGLSWTLQPGYAASNNKSIVAMSSDNPDNIIALNNQSMMYTLDGNNFNNSVGASDLSQTCTTPYNITCLAATDFTGTNINDNVFAAFRNITADRNYDCVFYYYDWDGSFNITTDGGINWCVVNNTDLPATSNIWQKTRLISIPDNNNGGHLWININEELWHSTDSGASWSNYSDLYIADKVKALSFGKGMNSDYVALYFYGNLDGESSYYLYRSDDIGINWTRVNDHSENESWGDPKIIAGDRNIAGRLYASVSGQGVIFGDSDNLPEMCDNTEKTIEGEFNDINSNDIPSWTVSEINNATMTGTINNWTKAVLDITTPGVNDFDLQLWQDDLVMEANKLYQIRVDLRADDARDVTLKLRNKSNGTTYLERKLRVLDFSQEYIFLFKPSVSDDDLRLTLMVGEDDETIYIDHIRFREFCEGDIADIDCVEIITLENHDIDPLTYHASNEIHSNGQVVNSADVTLKAVTFISMEEGFEIEVGASFLAEIEGCP